jgi:hypothetical protein
MTNLQLLKSLKDAFKKNTISEKTLAEHILPQVEKKIWATEPQLYLQALKVEIGRIPKGRVLKAEPEVKEYCTMMELDKNGRLVYEECWEGHPARGYLKYFDNDGDTTYSYTFTRSGDLDAMEYQQRKNGLPVAYGTYSRYAANFAETYYYDTGRLVKIDCEVSYLSTKQQPVYTINYDGLSNIRDIYRTDAPSNDFPEGQHVAVYQNNPYSLKTLTDIFTEETNAATGNTLEGNIKEYLLIILDRAFITDEWLPLKIYAIDGTMPFDCDMPVTAITDFEALPQPENISERLANVSRLLVQEITVQEKFDVPDKLLLKTAKEAKMKAGDIKILALDLYDDLSLTVA